MNPRPLLIPLLIVLAVVAAPAQAQAPATGASTTTDVPPPPPVPPPTCVTPEFPGPLASNTQIGVFNKNYKTYNECVRKYVDGNRAWLKAIEDANNKLVDEYNKFNDNLKKEIDAAKQ